MSNSLLAQVKELLGRRHTLFSPLEAEVYKKICKAVEDEKSPRVVDPDKQLLIALRQIANSNDATRVTVKYKKYPDGSADVATEFGRKPQRKLGK